MVRIAISKQPTGKLPPNAAWDLFNDSFVNRDVPMIELASAIYMGHAYAPWHNGRRKTENFICAQHIAVDMETHDDRSRLEVLAQHEFVQIYGAILHTTPSHTDTDPRARIIFLLDQPIVSASGYKTAINFVYSLFPGADGSCVDSSRFFYGAANCEMLLPENVLPVAHLRSLWQQARVNAPTKKDITPDRSKRYTGQYPPEQLVDWAVQDSAGRGRNNQGYILARRLRENGLPESEAENWMLTYQRQVEAAKLPKYSEREAMVNLKSAYRGG